jgi:hypothetical protein
MSISLLYNYLELSHWPISLYEFSEQKKNTSLHEYLVDSGIYIVAKKARLYFDNVSQSEEGVLSFDICQKESQEKIYAFFPIFLNEIIDPNINILQITLSPDNDEISIFNLDDKLITSFSPESFLYNYFKKTIVAKIAGNSHLLSKYEVLYVGKATEQHILKRITGHAAIQDVLSKETSISGISPPSHEIFLLFFRLKENSFGVYTFEEKDTDEQADKLLNQFLNHPKNREIYLDVEKALIKCLNPSYNSVKYKKYPVSNEGLYKYELDNYFYLIHENIILNYENGQIWGNIKEELADLIIVSKNGSKMTLESKSQHYGW